MADLGEERSLYPKKNKVNNFINHDFLQFEK